MVQALKIWQSSKHEIDRLIYENERYKSFMNTIPYEYCGWGTNGVQIISPGLEGMMNVDEIRRFDQLLDCFSAAERKKISGYFETLQKTGESFKSEAYERAGTRCFQIVGTRSKLGSGNHISMLWIEDKTPQINERTARIEEVERLKKTENLYETTFDQVPFPVWLRDEGGDLVWCNKAYAELFELSPPKVIDKQLELLNKTQARTLAQKSIQLQKAQTERDHIITNGERRYVEITERPLSGTSKNLGYMRDLSDLNQAIEDLEKVTQANTEVLEQLNLPVVVFGPDMNLNFFNSAYRVLWQFQEKWLYDNPSVAEVLDKLREQRKLPEQSNYREYVEKWRAHFTDLIETHEEMMYLPDGRVLRTVIVPHPAGGIMVTHEDVTSRLELESSYNTLIAVQNETINNLAEGVSVFGADGRLKLFNKAYKKIWKFDEEELKPDPHITDIVDLAKPYFRDEEWDNVRAKLISTCLERKAKSGRFARADGSILDYTLTPLPDGALLVSYLDVTDTVMVENALIEKNAALEEADQLKAGFLANVSYQLRTPLNAMIGFADVLEKEYFGDLNDKQREYVEGMVEAGGTLVQLIDDILDLSSIEAGYFTLDVEEFSVIDLVRSVQDLVKEWSGKNRQNIQFKVPKAIGSMKADQRRLRQVLYNLVQNAINFTPEGGIVEVLVKDKKQEEMIEVSVRDTGKGISQEKMDTIFKPFMRAQTANRKRGIGIGLSLARSIVELHGGDIIVESEEGQGTVFTMQLPRKAKV
ncbi:MAG: histidine kinase [Rickettsiales bacterium]|nr:histidine kinase [Rickettsiales bacterium]